jgi:hypothetical protein
VKTHETGRYYFTLFTPAPPQSGAAKTVSDNVLLTLINQ